MTTQVIEVKDARHLDLENFVKKIEFDHTHKLDLILPAKDIVGADGIIIAGKQNDSHVLNGTQTFHNGIAQKLSIPRQYYDKMLDVAPGLWDRNVNHWLEQANKNYFIRAMENHPDYGTFGRAFLSSSYKVIDNIDIMYVILDQIKQSGLQSNVVSCDITEDKMYMRINFPELITRSSALLKNYKTPKGDTDDDRISMSLEISNSETAKGQVRIAPQVKMLVCNNGMTRERDIIKRRHVGHKMEEDVIRWSQRSKNLNQQLIVSQLQDAIKQFLNIEYLEERVKELETNVRPLVDPMNAMNNIEQLYDINVQEKANILNHFLKGGQSTNFGMSQAVTWEAHQSEKADRQSELEIIGHNIMMLDDAALN